MHDDDDDLATATWNLGTEALRGAAAWSDVYLPEELWGEYASAAVNARCPREVYIALAIWFGVENASAAFQRMYFPRVERALARAGATPPQIATVIALLRDWLFEADSAQCPMVVTLAGAGQLDTVLRDAALRLVATVAARHLAA